MSYEQLVELLCTEDKRRRVEIVEQLQAALPDSLDAVLAGLRDDPRPLVRAACADVLDDAPQDQIVEEALRAASRDHDARVRHSALHSLSCARCKPDGCVVDDSLAILVDTLLNDSSIRLRRKMAGGLMHGQGGRGPMVVDAFRQVLENDTDKVLRERAGYFLAHCEVSREDRPYGEFMREWQARAAELATIAG